MVTPQPTERVKRSAPQYFEQAGVGWGRGCDSATSNDPRLIDPVQRWGMKDIWTSLRAWRIPPSRTMVHSARELVSDQRMCAEARRGR